MESQLDTKLNILLVGIDNNSSEILQDYFLDKIDKNHQYINFLDAGESTVDEILWFMQDEIINAIIVDSTKFNVEKITKNKKIFYYLCEYYCQLFDFTDNQLNEIHLKDFPVKPAKKITSKNYIKVFSKKSILVSFLILISVLAYAYNFYSTKVLNIAILSDNINFLHHGPNDRSIVKKEVYSRCIDLLYPSFSNYNKKSKKLFPNFEILDKCIIDNSNITFILKENIITNPDITKKYLTDYFTNLNAENIFIKNISGKIKIQFKINQDTQSFFIQLYQNRLIKKYVSTWKGIWDFDYQINNNVVSFDIKDGRYNIALNISFVPVYDELKNFTKKQFQSFNSFYNILFRKNYDLVYGINDYSIYELKKEYYFKHILFPKLIYTLYYNTQNINFSNRKKLYKIAESYKQNLNSPLNISIKSKYNIFVLQRDNCQSVADKLNPYFQNSGVPLNQIDLLYNNFSDSVAENKYDLLLATHYDETKVYRVLQAWGNNSPFNLSHYYPEVIKSGEYKNLEFPELKKSLDKELNENFIRINLGEFHRALIISPRFSDEQVKNFKETGIIYHLLNNNNSPPVF